MAYRPIDRPIATTNCKEAAECHFGLKVSLPVCRHIGQKLSAHIQHTGHDCQHIPPAAPCPSVTLRRGLNLCLKLRRSCACRATCTIQHASAMGGTRALGEFTRATHQKRHAGIPCRTRHGASWRDCCLGDDAPQIRHKSCARVS